MNSDITIRALMQIDRLQPKFAAYNGATVQGSIPLAGDTVLICLLYTSPSPRDGLLSRMPSSA